MKSRRFRTGLAACLVLTAGAAAAVAQSVARTPAIVEASSFRLDFAPQVDHEGATLTLSGPDHFYLRQTFAAADAISLGTEIDGVTLADGQYAWEIAFTPRLSAPARAALARARQTGDESALHELRASGALPSGPMVASGSFRVQQGAFVAGDQVEPEPGGAAGDRRGVVRQEQPSAQPGVVRVASEVQVIAQDLVVQGSTCVGLDCVSSESFGFDTIRMKENNTRIDFTDTSTTAGFPSQDWEIAANDSASGGRNALIFSDENTQLLVVESGNVANAVYVDSTGDVGLGTNTPVLDLHITRGDSPAIRLEQNSSSGFTAQTWDIAGNEANFFVRSATTGSQLPFRIRPGAPSSSIDISADGDVGIGTGSPSERLHVREDVNENTLLVVENPNTGNTAAGVVRAASNTAIVNFQAHGSGRTLVRFGETLGGWGELLAASGNGLIMGTLGATPVILGTNNTNVLEITSAGNVLHLGSQVHPDYVFEPDYPLETIEEHAEAMWTAKHLPAVGKGQYAEDGRAIYDLGASRAGLLEELEKAHIYIDQLNERLKNSETQIQDLLRRMEQLATSEAQVPQP
jgi:hypothetical protein